MLVEFDPDLLEPQPLGVRHAAGRHQHCVGGDRLAIVEVDEQRAVLLFLDRLKRRVRSEEQTSELQSLMRISYAVFCLKKKIQTHASMNSVESTRIQQ